MGMVERLYDWLGRRLDANAPSEGDVIAESLSARAPASLAYDTAVSYIAQMVAKCPVKVYRKGKLDDRAYESWVWNEFPNPNQSGPEFKAALVHEMFRSDKGAIVLPLGRSIYIARGTATKDALDGDMYDELKVGNRIVKGPHYVGDLYRFRMGGPSPAKSARGLDGTYGALLSSAASDFKRRSAEKWKLKLTARDAGDGKQREVIDEYTTKTLKKFTEADDTAVYPEFKGQELMRVGDGRQAVSSDAFVTLRKDCDEAVAGLLKMPSSMLYGNVNNYNEVFRSFMSFAVEPVIEVIEAEMTRKTFSPDEWLSESFCKLDTKNLKYTDLFDAAADADKLVAASILTPYDAAKWLGLDPVDEEWAHAYWMTKNYVPAGDAYAAGGGEPNE